jgi:hypothetical protein
VVLAVIANMLCRQENGNSPMEFCRFLMPSAKKMHLFIKKIKFFFAD